MGQVDHLTLLKWEMSEIRNWTMIAPKSGAKLQWYFRNAEVFKTTTEVISLVVEF